MLFKEFSVVKRWSNERNIRCEMLQHVKTSKQQNEHVDFVASILQQINVVSSDFLYVASV